MKIEEIKIDGNNNDSDKLSPELQKMQERYEEAEASCCPYCGSKNHIITKDYPSHRGAYGARAEVHCGKCNKTWFDVMNITHIEVIDDQGDREFLPINLPGV